MRTQTLGHSKPSIGPKLKLLSRNRAWWSPWLSSILSFSLCIFPQLARSYVAFDDGDGSNAEDLKVFGSLDDGRSNERGPFALSARQPPREEAPRDENSKIARAMELFQKGVDLYGNARYEAALEAFLDAQTLYPSPDFQYNIGSCYEQLEQYEAAVRAFKTYLRNKSEVADEANVRARISRLERLSETQIESVSNESPMHSRQPVSHQDNQNSAVVKKHQTGPDSSLQPRTSRVDRQAKNLIISGATVAGVGLVGGLLGSLIFGLKAQEKSDDIQRLSQGYNGNDWTLAEAKKADRQGRNAEMMQWISAGVGAGIFVAGAALLSFGLIKRQKHRRFAFHPGITRQSTFIRLSGRF